MRYISAITGRIFSSRTTWGGATLFSLVYFLIQFSQISEYGVTWDEPLHRNWGKVFSVFWQTGDRNLLELMPGYGVHYGPLFFYINYVLSDFLYDAGWFTFVEANHILTLILSTFVVGFTYALGQMFGGKKVGFLSACFLVLFPQFIAHAHYNPKDIPLMAFIAFTSLIFLFALRLHSKALLIGSAFLFGLSVAVKINALLMAPVFGITYFFWIFLDVRRSSLSTVLRHQTPVFFCAVAACVFGMYLFWPSAWGDWSLIPRSIQFFLGENFWPGTVLFFGVEYAGKDLPFYYVPFELAVAMPFLMLIAFVVGFIVTAFRQKITTSMSIEPFFLLLWIGFPLFYSMVPDLVRYDGIRQFYFILPAVAVLSAFGFLELLDLLHRRSQKPFSRVIFVALVFFSLITQVLSLHPFQGSYRNEILQLLYHKDLDQSFAIEYWGASYKQGIDWLTANAKVNATICVPTAGILVTWYPWREDFTFECSDKSDYVMFFTQYGKGDAYRQLKDPVFSIERIKSNLLVIYQIT